MNYAKTIRDPMYGYITIVILTWCVDYNVIRIKESPLADR